MKALWQLGTRRGIRGVGGEVLTSKEFGLRSSALLDSFTGELMRQLGGADLGGQFLRATGFSFTERINRTISALAGRNYAQNLFTKVARQVQRGRAPNKILVKELERLGISVDDALRRGSLEQNDLFSAAQQITNDTQFRTRAKDLPLWWNSPEGKIVNQFGQFAFKQTQLIKNEVVKELFKNPKRGLANLTKMVIAFPIAGEVFGRGRRKIRELLSGGRIEFEPIDKNILEAVELTGIDDPEIVARIIEDGVMVGATGRFMDMWQATQYGTLSEVSSLLGPSVPLGVAALEAARGEFGPLLKEGQRRIPFLAPIIVGPKRPEKKFK